MDEQAANSNAMTMHVTWRGSGAQNTSAITIRERSDLKCINLAYCDKWWVIVGDENDDIFSFSSVISIFETVSTNLRFFSN